MSDQFAEQIKKLQAFRHTDSDSAALEEFDEETERLILQRFGENTKHWEAYELAMMGEAETIVNMPQAAQEDATQDLFHKGIEQRRQVLEGCLADLVDATAPPAPRPSRVPSAPKPQPRAVQKKPGAVKKKKAAKKKARPAMKAAKKKKSGPAKKKRPAAGKKKAGAATKKRAKRK
jgi:outer membrane biosynthesis protein TonB